MGTTANSEIKGSVGGAGKTPIRLHTPGCYRVTLRPFLGDERFAQFVKGRFTSSAKWGDRFERHNNGRHWKVEIRYTETGEIIRFGDSVHRTLQAAVAEVAHEIAPALSSDSAGEKR